MSLDQLRAVVTIAEAGTIVRAAHRLHISQPPLTRKVRALEEELGVALFDRGARGMRPTRAGQAFLISARGILAAVEAAAASVRATTAPVSVSETEAAATRPAAGSASPSEAAPMSCAHWSAPPASPATSAPQPAVSVLADTTA